MGSFNYDKWNSLYISDDEDNTSSFDQGNGSRRILNSTESTLSSLRDSLRLSDTTGRYTLYTLPWDSTSEMIRWVLDLYGVDYEEIDLPWGLHIWETMRISASSPALEKLALPILLNDKTEAMYSPTSMMVYLYSKSFGSKLRIYSQVKTLEIQEQFDSNFSAATRTIFLFEVLSNTKLAEAYIRDQIHLNTWRTVNQLIWPIMRHVMWIYFKLGNQDTLDRAWRCVHKVFEQVESMLQVQAKSESDQTLSKATMLQNVFLTGSKITAADISFASHAALVLFPRDDDDYGGKIGMSMPPLKQLSPHTQVKVKTLRSLPAGRFALRLYRKERGRCIGHKPSKHAKVNNPKWASLKYLQLQAAIIFSGITVLIGVPLTMLFFYQFVLVLAIYLAVIYFALYVPNKDSIVLKRIHQCWQLLYEKYSSFFGISNSTANNVVKSNK
ncbi:hypothetical protein QVD99_007368 [Batrachochytrium dendrobatidis]|nr:hypothetical protein O5D80_008470 [Batrachochytrium dendrobatidis]KAK5665728.1 hypothetical protein QVD99_007368 [Batrachochytrium dendrobatidis]